MSKGDADQNVGVRPVEDRVWLVSYILGFFGVADGTRKV